MGQWLSELVPTLYYWSFPAALFLTLLLVYLRYRIDQREMHDAARHALVGHPCPDANGLSCPSGPSKSIDVSAQDAPEQV